MNSILKDEMEPYRKSDPILSIEKFVPLAGAITQDRSFPRNLINPKKENQLRKSRNNDSNHDDIVPRK